MSNTIYENYLGEQRNGTQIMKAVFEEQEVNAVQNSQQVDENGRFPFNWYGAIKHLPTRENEEGIMKLHILLLLISLGQR